MGCCMSKPKVGTDEHAMRKDYYQKMQKKENNGQQTTEHQAQYVLSSFILILMNGQNASYSTSRSGITPTLKTKFGFVDFVYPLNSARFRAPSYPPL